MYGKYVVGQSSGIRMTARMHQTEENKSVPDIHHSSFHQHWF